MFDDIRQFTDPVLKSACAPVQEFGEKTVKLGRTLLDRLVRYPIGIGLAANQIGVSRRAFAYDLTPYGLDQGVLFNPRLVDATGATVYEEGCLSIPDFFYPVERPSKVTVQACSEAGDDLEFELDGIAARLFQHEIDHLDGILIFDRLPEDERKQAIRTAMFPGDRAKAPSRRRTRRFAL